MKYLIFSDVHANLSALEVLFNSDFINEVERIICLGDIIGYGAFPLQCLRRIREKAHVCLMGNHEMGILRPNMEKDFSYFARIALQWTRPQLDEEGNSYLKSLPFLKEENDLVFVHATPDKPENFYYHYMLDNDLLFNSFSGFLCFCGHTHQPHVIDESGHILRGDYFELNKNSRYIIDVGSVGQPRDHDRRGCAVLYDSTLRILQFIRFEYEIEREAQAIRQANLPDFLSSRLYYGE